MAAEETVGSNRPRPWLLVALGLAVLVFIATWMWPAASATPAAPASRARPMTAASLAPTRTMPTA